VPTTERRQGEGEAVMAGFPNQPFDQRPNQSLDLVPESAPTAVESKPGADPEVRSRRLAAALRDNLHRRKAQARGRQRPPGDEMPPK
jgi:hypothetical protein